MKHKAVDRSVLTDPTSPCLCLDLAGLRLVRCGASPLETGQPGHAVVGEEGMGHGHGRGATLRFCRSRHGARSQRKEGQGHVWLQRAREGHRRFMWRLFCCCCLGDHD